MSSGVRSSRFVWAGRKDGNAPIRSRVAAARKGTSGGKVVRRCYANRRGAAGAARAEQAGPRNPRSESPLPPLGSRDQDAAVTTSDSEFLARWEQLGRFFMGTRRQRLDSPLPVQANSITSLIQLVKNAVSQLKAGH